MFFRQTISTLGRRGLHSTAALGEAKLHADLENQASPLRQVSTKIEQFPLSAKDRAICDLLRQKLSDIPDSVGFAAPQFGFNRRIIVVGISDEMVELSEGSVERFPATVLVNPQLYPVTNPGIMEAEWETCFSDRYNTALVYRPHGVWYQAYDEAGEWLQGWAYGLLARALQHETDHLDGIMPKDRAEQYLSIEEVFGINRIGNDDDYRESPRIQHSFKP